MLMWIWLPMSRGSWTDSQLLFMRPRRSPSLVHVLIYPDRGINRGRGISSPAHDIGGREWGIKFTPMNLGLDEEESGFHLAGG